MSRQSSPRPGPLVTGSVAAGLLALAAAAAPEGFGWLSKSARETVVVVPDPPDLFAYLVLAFMAASFVLYSSLRIASFRQRPARKVAPIGPRIALLMLLVVAWALLPPVQRAVRETLEAIRPDGRQQRQQDDSTRPGGPDRHSSEELGYVVTALAAAALVGLGLGAVWLLRDDSGEPQPLEPGPEAADQVEASIDDLESISDPRAAIVACYGRLQSAAERAGIARRASDAPFELLHRLLGRLGASERAAVRLTELFETARFSTHDVNERMRAEAIAALAEVRDRLEAPT